MQTTQLSEHLWQSVLETFETMIPLPLQRVDDPKPAPSDGPLWAGSITFTGDLRGCLTLLCSADCGEKMARTMLMLEDSEPVDEADLKDALGEIANLAIGGLKSRLLAAGCTLDISIPTVTRGRDLRPALGVDVERFSLLIETEGHTFEFVLACK
ncbi:MAG TPA: chemotaxis protein CheX [Phycisphaerales bacterium]|nr:chemotaxis protein CheX [Phycisphaerales bacterium]